MSIEIYKNQLIDLIKKVNDLGIQDSLDFAHELFSQSTSLYINLAYASAGKEGWKERFNQAMQIELDALYMAMKSPEAEKYVDSLPEK